MDANYYTKKLNILNITKLSGGQRSNKITNYTSLRMIYR